MEMEALAQRSSRFLPRVEQLDDGVRMSVEGWRLLPRAADVSQETRQERTGGRDGRSQGRTGRRDVAETACSVF